MIPLALVLPDLLAESQRIEAARIAGQEQAPALKVSPRRSRQAGERPRKARRPGRVAVGR